MVFKELQWIRSLLRTITPRKSTRKMNDTIQAAGGTTLAGICQMRATSNCTNNLSQVIALVEMAKEKNIKFLFFPECCDYVAETSERTRELAEPLDGGTVTMYKMLASTNKMWLSFGGIHESILDDNKQKTGKVFNTHLVINDEGDIVGVYRKLHLFDASTPHFDFRESDVVYKGKAITAPIDTPIGKLGMQTCYDLRFPETSRILRKFGAEILTYPSAFAYSTGKDHWEVLLRARAIENQCYVIAPAQIGFHNGKRRSYGRAMIIDPWGNIKAECSTDMEVASAHIELDYLRTVRTNMPCFDHRRSDLYALVPVNLCDDSEIPEPRFGEHIIPKDTIFFKSQYCFAFTNIRCVVRGHVLVATKRPAKRLHDLTGEEVADLFETVVTIQKYLEQFYNATSATITVQDGVDAGQTVNHVHFHIMPRHKNDFTFNDEIYVELNKHDTEEGERRSVKEMEEEAAAYREYIAKGKGPIY